MSHNSYLLLLLLALVVNVLDRRMLLLCVIVGAGVLLPIPMPRGTFYLVCAFGDTLIGALAIKLQSPASTAVARISFILVLFHVMGHFLNGYPITSPYHILVKVCEHAELVFCILLSRPFSGDTWKN